MDRSRSAKARAESARQIAVEKERAASRSGQHGRSKAAKRSAKRHFGQKHKIRTRKRAKANRQTKVNGGVGENEESNGREGRKRK